MKLVEREDFLVSLRKQFKNVAGGEGHCLFISGEAGIGKTSLVKAFCKEQKSECNIYQGACDALFTPRPLAPFYDIMWQVHRDLSPHSHTIDERFKLFSDFFRELSKQKEKSIIIFEDIHWADEATLDFIKFFARRITQLQCLFILTYRDDEIHSRHPLRNVLGQLPPDSFTKLQLTPLSRQAVEKMAGEKGYSGEDVYSISGGNPFYVNEILASYSLGVPDSIKNSILSTYDNANKRTKQIWDLLAVIPNNFEIKYLEEFELLHAEDFEKSLATKILVINDGYISFKHELFRKTIEHSLSPLKRISLNKKILEQLREKFDQNQEIERIVHHAKNANEYGLVVQYAPIAAKKAALLGAHIEAARLYLTAIEYYQGKDKNVLLQFYEAYAYECYLTNQIKEAIIYTSKSLELWKEKKDIEKTGNCMRFLSRLWWNDGNQGNAESFARQAIEVLDQQPSSDAKAMAYGNMAQLKTFVEQADECIFWGEKTIAMSKELANNEILSYALNNVGSVQIRIPSSMQRGTELLQQSLDIALKNSYHEHAARAYTIMGYSGIIIKDTAYVKKALEAGMLYCEENNLELWTTYLLTIKARTQLDTGSWDEACQLAENLINNENLAKIIKIFSLTILATIKMRRGGKGEILALLVEAKEKAFETMELQRILRALVAFLEYEWITGERFIEKDAIDSTVKIMEQAGNIYDNSEFAFWLLKVRNERLSLQGKYKGYETDNIPQAQQAAALWQKSGYPYQQALSLFDGNEDDKRKAITIVHGLGAHAVYEKMKREMRALGIKNIPRGIRKTTQANPALLTGRELDVLQLLNENMQNKEIAAKLFLSPKTVDHHISAILFKLDVNSRIKAVQEATRLGIIK